MKKTPLLSGDSTCDTQRHLPRDGKPPPVVPTNGHSQSVGIRRLPCRLLDGRTDGRKLWGGEDSYELRGLDAAGRVLSRLHTLSRSAQCWREPTSGVATTSILTRRRVRGTRDCPFSPPTAGPLCVEANDPFSLTRPLFHQSLHCSHKALS